MGWQDAGALPETQGGNGSLPGANPTFAASLGQWCQPLMLVLDAFQCRGGQREKGKLNPGETCADEAPWLRQKWQKAGKPAERSAQWSPCTKAAL